MFSFYYVNNYEEAKDILPKCQYAICPFIAKLDENLDEHLNRLKSFVKYYQPMCDIRFLYYTNEIENSDRFDEYIQKICNLCVHLYTRNGGKWLQQDIGSKKISKASEKDDYKIFLKHIALECSEERSIEFKDWTGHDVLRAGKFEMEEKEIENSCIREEDKDVCIEGEYEKIWQEGKGCCIEEEAIRDWENIYFKYTHSKGTIALIQGVLNNKISPESIKEIFKSAEYEADGSVKIMSVWRRLHLAYYMSNNYDYNCTKTFCDTIFNDLGVRKSLLKLIKDGGGEQALAKLSDKIREDYMPNKRLIELQVINSDVDIGSINY